MNNHGKKKYGTPVLAAFLVIGLCIGAAAGFAAGRMTAGSGSGAGNEADAVDDYPDLSGVADFSDPDESFGFSEEENIVLTIDGTDIYMDEINVRVYMARDKYVGLYGEEPWDIETEDGITVRDYAKQEILDDITELVILCEKAEEYGVEQLTEDELDGCSAQADVYMEDLGSDVAGEFGVTWDAMYTIYSRENMAMKVYNAVLDEIAGSLQSDPDDGGESGEVSEGDLMDAYDALLNEWKNSCAVQLTDVWDELMIGALG